MKAPSLLPSEINHLTEAEFVSLLGFLFENSPWVAQETWPHRPFLDSEDLLAKLCTTLRQAPEERRVEVIRAHPDLAGKLNPGEALTVASTQEQASAGLDRLSPEEARLFTAYNSQYKARFGFPFVICARLSDRATMLAAFEKRLSSSREQEIKTAVAEIEKIASLRLERLQVGFSS